MLVLVPKVCAQLSPIRGNGFYLAKSEEFKAKDAKSAKKSDLRNVLITLWSTVMISYDQLRSVGAQVEAVIQLFAFKR